MADCATECPTRGMNSGGHILKEGKSYWLIHEILIYVDDIETKADPV